MTTIVSTVDLDLDLAAQSLAMLDDAQLLSELVEENERRFVVDIEFVTEADHTKPLWRFGALANKAMAIMICPNGSLRLAKGVFEVAEKCA